MFERTLPASPKAGRVHLTNERNDLTFTCTFICTARTDLCLLLKQYALIFLKTIQSNKQYNPIWP